jgi:hypothetical protein
MTPHTGVRWVFFRIAVSAFVAALSACSHLLPDARQEVQTPWTSYAAAQAMFDRIVPGKTTLDELKSLGVDPEKTPNVVLLSHADLLRRLLPSVPIDVRQLDPGLQECLSAKDACFGYEIEQLTLDRKRYGNFWLDFLNFKRQVDITGWQFDAVVVIKKETVVYKMWSGKPSVHRFEEERSPLGPLQGFGSTLVK